MLKLLGKKISIEKELFQTTKIFGEIYTVEVVYKKDERSWSPNTEI